MAMNRVIAIAGLLTSLGLAGAAPGPALAQSRVIMPIVIQVPPRATTPLVGTPSTHVTTRTTTPQPGVTTTRITVQDTTGAGRTVGVSPGAGGIVGMSPGTGALTTVRPGTPSVLVTVDQRVAPNTPGATGAVNQTRVTVSDVSQSGRVLGGSPAVSPLRGAGRGQQTLVITSDAPIDAPIVILAP